MTDWKDAFSKGKWPIAEDELFYSGLSISSIEDLKFFMDMVHARQCLLKPYFQKKDYPVIETRALLPSFEADPFEYHDLPGFSQLVLDRPLASFNEIFQYDLLYPVTDLLDIAQGDCCPLESTIMSGNTQSILARLPRDMHEQYRRLFQRADITVLASYPNLLPFILTMDRAHVISKNTYGDFKLAGVFASFPSDIDGELKRFGMRIGKFRPGDNELYERNRLFVMQFLMELYGYPIASERRTSAALFARRLHKMGERFMIRVLGQSDRVVTTMWNTGENKRYPNVEKMALIRLDEEQKDLLEEIKELDAFVDAKNRVILIKVQYRQHAFDPNNVRQERALSVSGQQLIHPVTGEPLEGLNIIRDYSNLILRINDIVRGEFSGRVMYKRTEVIENTDTEEKRLKFLYSWLTKHQRRFIGYSDEFFARTSKILEAYFQRVEDYEIMDELRDLAQEVKNRYLYIKQARKIRKLEEIRSRSYRGEKLTYDQMLGETLDLMHGFKFEVSVYFDDLVDHAVVLMENMLEDRYLRKTYIEKPESQLTKAGLEIRKKYGKLVILHDDVTAIWKTHQPVVTNVL